MFCSELCHNCKASPKCSVTDARLRRGPVAFLADHARNTYIIVDVHYSNVTERQGGPLSSRPGLEIFLDRRPLVTQRFRKTYSTPIRRSIVHDVNDQFPTCSARCQSIPLDFCNSSDFRRRLFLRRQYSNYSWMW